MYPLSDHGVSGDPPVTVKKDIVLSVLSLALLSPGNLASGIALSIEVLHVKTRQKLGPQAPWKDYPGPFWTLHFRLLSRLYRPHFWTSSSRFKGEMKKREAVRIMWKDIA